MGQEIKREVTTAMFDRTVQVTVAPGYAHAAVEIRSQKDPKITFTLPVRIKDLPRPQFDDLFEDEDEEPIDPLFHEVEQSMGLAEGMDLINKKQRESDKERS